MNDLNEAMLGEAFQSLELKSSDKIFLHIDTAFLAQLPKMTTIDRFIFFSNFLKSYFANSGMVIVPTFTYSFCNNVDFNVRDTDCDPQIMGHFPDHFRKLPNVLRTSNPIFSCAIYTKNILNMDQFSNTTCFGRKSIFDYIHNENAKIVFIGCSLDRATFIHYCEEMFGVNYRYLKTFSGHVVFDDKTIKKISTEYFVKDLKQNRVVDTTNLKNLLLSEKKLNVVEVGRTRIMSVNAQDFYKYSHKILESHINGLTKSGQ